MRDLLVISLVVWGCVLALRRPWVGVMVWTWLSIMNPHRYCFGIAYDAPLAAAAAGVTLLGFLFTTSKSSPVKGAPVVWLLVFVVWITLSWMFGLDPSDDYDQWKKVMKVQMMIIVALSLLQTKEHVIALVWVAAGSLALLGIKGGIYSISSGGAGRVWGPPGSFIADNNEFALALVTAIPLLRFLQMQLTPGWRRHAMTVTMVLCAASALGSQSRGALLAISAMAVILWWRGRSRVLGGVVIALVAFSLVSFMPDTWGDRMSTMKTYDEDRSAMGRFSAWWTAFGIAKNYLFGVGFNAARPFLFDLYSPIEGMGTPAAHSIYFQVLGNHGFIGLLLYLGLGLSTYRWASKLQREAKNIPEAQWCADLASMCQVALFGFAVGGTFLSLAYFDLPYNLTVMVVVARVWVRKKSWLVEPKPAPGWRTLPGLAPLARSR